jgi:energy-coupling factor transporter transmembrane protein EcfT
MTRWKPATALIVSLEATLVATVVDRPANLMTIAAVAALWTAPVLSRRAWPWLLVALGLMSWTLAMTQGFFWAGQPRTVLVQILSPAWWTFGDPPGLALYREGVLHGLVESLRGHALLWIAAGLVARYGVEELTRGLRALGLPGAASVLAVLAVRQMPLLVDEARTAWTALRLKGLGPGAAVRAVWVPLLTGHLRRADEVAAALYSRGIGTAAKESVPPHAPVRERLIAWAGGLLAGTLALALLLAKLHLAGLLPLPAGDALSAWVHAYV